MKKLLCPLCGKELINTSPDKETGEAGDFYCDSCRLDIEIYPDEETPVSISSQTGGLRADWYNAGEGYSGEYRPDDPNDKNLLRFDIYYAPKEYRKENAVIGVERSSDPVEWDEVEDASYCTLVPADTKLSKLVKLLSVIWREYWDVIDAYPEHPVKKLGERLSWISPD